MPKVRYGLCDALKCQFSLSLWFVLRGFELIYMMDQIVSRPSQQTSDNAIQGFDRDKEEGTCHLKEPGDSNDPPLSEEEVEEMLGNDLNI